MRARSRSDEASNASVNERGVEREPRFERCHELVPALAGQRRDGDRPRVDRLKPRALAGVEPIELVEHFDRWHLVCDLLRPAAAPPSPVQVGVRWVDHMPQQVEAATSSSVARNAATSACGSRSMSPTVSDTSSSRLSGSRTFRTSGSSVTNSASEATA